MRTIRTTVTISEDGRITALAPTGLPPGKRKAVLVLEDDDPADSKVKRHALPLTPRGRLAETASMRREDMYGDSGR